LEGMYRGGGEEKKEEDEGEKESDRAEGDK
jgi:hypothetical protein